MAPLAHMGTWPPLPTIERGSYLLTAMVDLADMLVTLTLSQVTTQVTLPQAAPTFLSGEAHAQGAAWGRQEGPVNAAWLRLRSWMESLSCSGSLN